MKKETVKRRIFISNTWMVLTSLFAFFLINYAVIGGYLESAEAEIRASAEQIAGDGALKDWILNWTFRRNEFWLLIGIDVVLCVAVFLVISRVFTKNLSANIMEPLNALTEGAERIRKNDLSHPIEYKGDAEFEEVCAAFDEMQGHLLDEQEKNRAYEKARTDMIAGISHDLRTPLTAVRGSIKGLLDGVASSPQMQERFLQTAYRRTGDMDALLNQLFYFSKMETGNMPLSLQRIEISEFLQTYVSAKKEAPDAKGVELAFESGEVLAQIQADPEQLWRILDNLWENSRKYADCTPLKVRIILSRISEGICVRFQDNGAGVPEEKLPFVFDEFYRCDESRNKKDGNGLGLYIVKYLIEAMGGRVSAENADGFAVCIRLPEHADCGSAFSNTR